MTEATLVDTKPSKELEIKVTFDGEKLQFDQVYEGKGMGEEFKIHVHSDLILDAIAAKVNNPIVTGIITALKGFLKMLSGN
jgi:hypothetical protein